MLLLFVLMLIDFLLTYIGVSIGVIKEGNPLIAWSFNLPYWQSIGVRLISVLLVFIPLLILYRMNPNVYKKVLILAYIVNFIIIIIHLYWIITKLG